MNAPAPEATHHDSRAPRSAPTRDQQLRIGLLMRGFLALSGVAGVVLLALATRATIIEIRLSQDGGRGSGVDTALSGADRHGPALIIVGVFAAMMLAGALRDARPAMLGLAAAGLIALAIAVLGDARHIHDTGAIGQIYPDARAGAAGGFYLETLGGALLLVAGGGLLLLAGGAVEAGGAGVVPRVTARRRRPSRRDRLAVAGERERTTAPAAVEDEPGSTSAQRPAPVDDWFSDAG